MANWQTPEDDRLPRIPNVSGLQEIGRGGSAAVYQADHESLGPVAVKVFTMPLRDERSRTRFKSEVDAFRRAASNGGFVALHDWGYTFDGHPYLILELCASSLKRLAEKARPRAEDVARIGYQAALALAAFHKGGKGQRHGDISPANILLDGYGNVRLSDLGLASASGSQDAATWDHAAPEVWSGTGIGQESDVYGLGSTLFTVLTGAPPVVRKTHERHEEFGLRALSRRVSAGDLPSVPVALAGIVVRMLDHSPANRPTAAEVAEALAAPVSSAPAWAVSATDGPVSETGLRPADSAWPSAPRGSETSLREIPLPQPLRRNRTTVAIVAGVAALLVVTGGFAVYRMTHAAGPSAAATTTLTPPPDLAGPPITLAEPVDHGSTVDLSWTGQPGWQYAVVIIEVNADQPRTVLLSTATTYAAQVDPDKRYCFLVQGSGLASGEVVTGDSALRGIRSADCGAVTSRR